MGYENGPILGSIRDPLDGACAHTRQGRPALVETTALGAAGLAGLALGLWSDAEDFLTSQGEATRFTPSMSDSERALLFAGWARAVQAVKGLAALD